MRDMSIIVVRHAPFREAYNDPLRGYQQVGPQLTEEGRTMIPKELVPSLEKHRIDPKDSRVAISNSSWTRLTAEAAGFKDDGMTAYGYLDDVAQGMERSVLHALLKAGKLPKAAIRRAKEILTDPPQESVWISHGLVIAGLCEVLGVTADFERPVPQFCEVRVLDIAAYAQIEQTGIPPV